MADLKLTKLYTRQSFPIGSLVARTEKRGILARLARVVYSKTKWQWLERFAYEAAGITAEDFKTPIGIAIDKNTILFSGSLPFDALPDKEAQKHRLLSQLKQDWQTESDPRDAYKRVHDYQSIEVLNDATE